MGDPIYILSPIIKVDRGVKKILSIALFLIHIFLNKVSFSCLIPTKDNHYYKRPMGHIAHLSINRFIEN